MKWGGKHIKRINSAQKKNRVATENVPDIFHSSSIILSFFFFTQQLAPRRLTYMGYQSWLPEES